MFFVRRIGCALSDVRELRWRFAVRRVREFVFTSKLRSLMSRRSFRWVLGKELLGLFALAALSGCGSNETDNDGQTSATGGVGVPTGGVEGTGATSTGGTSNVGGGGGVGTGGVASGGGATATGGATSEACHEPSEAGSLITRLPCLLSETGLYQADMVTLAEGVRPFTPSFPLWTDGAEKKRWISLPSGTQIDTSNMDFWQFPAGTKLWKEFARDGVRVETRLIEKKSTGAWHTVAYQWRQDQTEADAVPNGVVNASGTEHDIPNAEACLTCHGQQPDKVLGFSAIQLSHDGADPLEWTLDGLIEAGALTAPPAAAFSVPGTETERDFFGYLHANCGHCHNPSGAAFTKTGLDMWLRVADLSGPVNELSVYKLLYDVDVAWLDGSIPEATKRVSPGSFADSALYQRFMTKGQAWSMPPLGTEVVDPKGQQLFETWIQALE
jgi:hypothetical protein